MTEHDEIENIKRVVRTLIIRLYTGRLLDAEDARDLLDKLLAGRETLNQGEM